MTTKTKKQLEQELAKALLKVKNAENFASMVGDEDSKRLEKILDLQRKNKELSAKVEELTKAVKSLSVANTALTNLL